MRRMTFHSFCRNSVAASSRGEIGGSGNGGESDGSGGSGAGVVGGYYWSKCNG